MIGMSKALAAEVASRNITVNCVAPGFIATAMTDVLPDEQKGKLTAAVPAGRLGDQRISLPVWFTSPANRQATSRGRHCISTAAWP